MIYKFLLKTVNQIVLRAATTSWVVFVGLTITEVCWANPFTSFLQGSSRAQLARTPLLYLRVGFKTLACSHVTPEEFRKSLAYIYRELPNDPYYEVDGILLEHLNENLTWKDRNLADLECQAIFAYTHRAYGPLNSQLNAQGSVDAEMTAFLDVLLSALRKLEPHDGLVFRSTILPEMELSDLKKGELLTINSFWSASLVSPCDVKTPRIGRHQFEIYSQTGKSIQELSLYPSEQEVLFQPETRFEILDLLESPTEDPCELKIILQELPKDV